MYGNSIAWLASCLFGVTFLGPIQAEDVGATLRLDCGSRALFAFLQLNECDVTFGAVDRSFGDYGLEGLSIVELRDSAKGFGIPCQIERLEFDDLKDVRTPVVFLVKDKGAELGHYLVAVPSLGGVKVLDALRAELRGHEKLEGYRQKYCGFALVAVPSRPEYLIPALAVASVILTIGVVVQWSRIRAFC